MHYSTLPKGRQLTTSLLHIILGLAFIFMCLQYVDAQPLSHFDWEVSPPIALVGPSALSVSPAAAVSNNGANGTRGLNPGRSMQAIDLVLPGSIANHDGLLISIDFQRDESFGYLWDRGNYLSLRMIWGELKIQYRVTNGNGSQTITATNIYAVPFDNLFRTYTFMYNATTGEGKVQVDGTTVWSHFSGPNQPLHTTNAPDFVIGRFMSGIGQNQPIFDNFNLVALPMAPLPVELTAFTATAIEGQTVLNWTTASESNNARFVVERSADGLEFYEVGALAGAGTTAQVHAYQLVDPTPLPGISYYRIRQVDFDGREQPFELVAVEHPERAYTMVEALVFPNPSSGHNHSVLLWGLPPNREVTVSIFNTAGNRIATVVAHADPKGAAHARFDYATQLQPGTYLIASAWETDRLTTKLVVNR